MRKESQPTSKFQTPRRPNFKINNNIVPQTPKKPRAIEQDAGKVSEIAWEFEETVSLDKEMNFFYYLGPGKTSLIIEDVCTYLPGSANEDKYGNFVFRLQTDSQSLINFARSVRQMCPSSDWQFSPAGNAMQEGILIMKLKITDMGLGHYFPNYKNNFKYPNSAAVDGYVSSEDVKEYLDEHKNEITIKFGVGLFFNVVKKSYGLFTMVHSIV